MKPFIQLKPVPPECERMQSLCGRAGCTRDEARDEARRIPRIREDMEIQNGSCSPVGAGTEHHLGECPRLVSFGQRLVAHPT